MIFLPHILPQPALQPFIQDYFLMHIKLKDGTDSLKPIPPDANQSLIFYPRNKVYAINNSSGERRLSSSSIFVAQQTTRVNIQFSEDHLIIQVNFLPGMIYQLLGKMPVTVFEGIERDGEYLAGDELRILNDQLQETNDYKQMILLIENYLLKKIRQVRPEASPIDKAIAFLKYSDKPFDLDWLADQACLSSRQFERNFLQRMGMSPKFYGRISRFDKAYKEKLKRPDKQWLDIAYQFGYFDLSHLVRDFKQFAEVTPSLMIAQEKASPEWMG